MSSSNLVPPEANRNPSRDLLSTEYVSFGHVVRQHNKNKKLSNASSFSSAATPAFKKELSLFPLFDKFILYTPCYVVKDRNKMIHIPIIIFVIIIFILRAINYSLYFIFIDKEHHHYNNNYEVRIFVILMFILPFINNIIRMHYFLKYFNFSLWHYPSYINPKSGIKTINNQILNKLSFLLRRPAFAKNKIGKNFRLGWFCIMIIILTSIIFRIILYKHFSESVVIYFNVSSLADSLYGIIWSLLYAVFFDIPDLLCLLVARIHFTECQLYIRHFTEELISMSLDEIVELNIFHRYLMMHKDIKNYIDKFYYFIVIMSFEVLFGIWYGVNYILSLKTWNNKYEIEIFSLYIIFWIISTFIIALQLIFALSPALKMTQLNNILLYNVNHKIDDIMFNRQRFHDNNMLNDFIDIVCKTNGKHKKSNKYSYSSYSSHHSRYNTMRFLDKTVELKNKMSKYSIQKCALDILTQLLYAIEEKPCSYQLLGITIDKSSIRDLVIALIIGQLFSIMWQSV